MTAADEADAAAPVSNEVVFEQDSVVAFYAAMAGLFPAEQRLFAAYVRPSDRVLDLGVGAGRTSDWLSGHAASYVGTDLSRGMIDTARATHPGVDLDVADASDLSEYADSSFDVVVFSFNGIDCLDDRARARCLGEVRRVLSPGGRFVLSRHNPRWIVARPKPLRGVSWKVGLHRLGTAALESLRLGANRLCRAPFWRGEGREHDRAHGGLDFGIASPRRASAELSEFGLTVVEGPIDRSDPRKYRWLTSSWYYVVATTARLPDS